jgi:Fe-S-cluster containining protein
MARGRRDKVWYEQGLRFECTQCGQCCSGSSGTVEFTPEEARGMASILGLTYQEFMDRYAVRRGPTWILREVPSEEDGYDCVLLAREAETGLTRCTVHRERPMQCRTWPFWPENLKSARTWRQAGRECEGIDRGAAVSYREICHNRDLTPEPGKPYADPQSEDPDAH